MAACGGGSSPPLRAGAQSHTASTTTTVGISAGPPGAPATPMVGGTSGTGTGSGTGSSGGGGAAGSPTTVAAATATTQAPTATTQTTSRPTTTTTSAPTTTTTGSQTVSASDTSGGLTVTLTATPATAPAGTAVRFTIKASESHAPGALTYQLTYGDGSSDQNTAPTTCRGGTGSPVQQTWSLSHPYTKKGSYFARVTVRAACTPDQATATITITIS